MTRSTRASALARAGLLSALAAGCAPVVSYSGDAEAPKRSGPRHPVEVFDGTVPVKPHLEVGQFEVQRGNSTADRAGLLAAMVQEASAQECDAVVIAPVVPDGKRVTSLEGKCVVYATSGPLSPGPGATGGTRALAGCTVDTECKGDRICERGACVSPAR